MSEMFIFKDEMFYFILITKDFEINYCSREPFFLPLRLKLL